MDADLELLKAENKALRGQVADLERTVERQQATIARLTAANERAGALAASAPPVPAAIITSRCRTIQDDDLGGEIVGAVRSIMLRRSLLRTPAVEDSR